MSALFESAESDGADIAMTKLALITSASDVAEKIYRAAEAARPRPRYLVTPQTYIAAFITRFMPTLSSGDY